MRIDDIRQGFSEAWDSLRSTAAEGWERLRRSAAGALTRLTPGEKTQMPAPAEIDDPSYLPSPGWAMLGGDVFEDDRRVVVRIEAPGMERSDFDLQVIGDTLVVRGEKRFERESTEGRWRMLECAYGAFHRSIPLPARVRGEDARATYRNGVLRVELPKVQPSTPRTVKVRVA